MNHEVAIPPLDGDLEGEQREAESSGVGLAAPCRLLLVDDDTDITEILQMLLESRGFEVITASSVKAAVEMAASGQIDVLVSDLALPDGNGCDLLLRLRATRRIPAIVVSGSDREVDLKRCRDAGFDEHIVKPMTIDRLVQAIQRVRDA